MFERLFDAFRRPGVSNVKEIEPRRLTEREAGWISEILQTAEDWRAADISKTRVVAEGPCDEGFSLMLRAPEPQTTNAGAERGYIGRLVILTSDDCCIEVRLTQISRHLNELFILFVDPDNPRRTLPEIWAETSREAFSL